MLDTDSEQQKRLTQYSTLIAQELQEHLSIAVQPVISSCVIGVGFGF